MILLLVMYYYIMYVYHSMLLCTIMYFTLLYILMLSILLYTGMYHFIMLHYTLCIILFMMIILLFLCSRNVISKYYRICDVIKDAEKWHGFTLKKKYRSASWEMHKKWSRHWTPRPVACPFFVLLDSPCWYIGFLSKNSQEAIPCSNLPLDKNGQRGNVSRDCHFIRRVKWPPCDVIKDLLILVWIILRSLNERKQIFAIMRRLIQQLALKFSSGTFRWVSFTYLVNNVNCSDLSV